MGPFEVIVGSGTGTRCVPLISGMEESKTNLGDLVILGMPLFREYAVVFDRPYFGIALAKIPPGSTSCDQCPSTVAELSTNPKEASRAARGESGALLPASDMSGLGAIAIKNRSSDMSVVPQVRVPMRSEHLRFPWWAVQQPRGVLLRV